MDKTTSVRPGNNVKHGYYGTRTYSTWQAMKNRCYNTNHVAYHRYGGRGIKVCDEWIDSFPAFLRDMGDRPENTSIERIKNDLGYFKENCRWAKPKEQTSNRSNNRILFHNERAMPISLWAIETGMKESTLRERIRRGWSDCDALTVPVSKKKIKCPSSNNAQASQSCACPRSEHPLAPEPSLVESRNRAGKREDRPIGAL